MSARANTSLEPHCIYGGTNPHHLTILKRLGAKVTCHTPSIADDLRHGYGDEAYPIFKGHWLRLDLPTLETRDDVILYTDIDVMFLSQPSVDKTPRTLAVTPEQVMDDQSYFNSGVMVMNLKRLRKLQGAFVKSIKNRLSTDFSYPPHDQGSYNRFFHPSKRNRIMGRASTWMALENNWKPYWGANSDARIVHFHGPKPPNIRLFEKGIHSPDQRGLVALWERDPGAYADYCTQWETYDAQGQALLQRV